MINIISIRDKLLKKFKITFSIIDLFSLIVYIKELDKVSRITTKDKSYVSGYLDKYNTHKKAMLDLGVSVGESLRNPKEIKKDIASVVRKYADKKEVYREILKTLGEENIGNLPTVDIKHNIKTEDDGWTNCENEDCLHEHYEMNFYEQMIYSAMSLESEIGQEQYDINDDGQGYLSCITESDFINYINTALSKI